MRRWLWIGLFVAACGGEPPDPCEDAPRYEPTIKALVDTHCINCHASDVSGTNRQGAPIGLDFDDFATLQPNIEQFADSFTSGLMPPRDQPTNPPLTSAGEREQVQLWRQCGFPQM